MKVGDRYSLSPTAEYLQWQTAIDSLKGTGTASVNMRRFIFLVLHNVIFCHKKYSKGEIVFVPLNLYGDTVGLLEEQKQYCNAFSLFERQSNYSLDPHYPFIYARVITDITRDSMQVVIPVLSTIVGTSEGYETKSVTVHVSDIMRREELEAIKSGNFDDKYYQVLQKIL